ncbi:hypothetical protein BDV96DRAFT_652876 [Lophiotrema nucula]|uniref:Uncharacterized protein n=1 Tax=Lophiotrema nucula TaxID=690887 RepID=A0A6A5YMI2_9PLEO|nr:hypothetical protein BDV96DRAFT_652876 [Lophiotrema nucula]
MSSFPAIEGSFRFLPHTPSFTYGIPATTSATPQVDSPPISPLSATTSINYHGPVVASGPMPQTTLLTLPYLYHHTTHTVTVTLPHTKNSPSSTFPSLNSAMSIAATSSPSSSPSPSSASSSTTQDLPQGAKIGIALGITVTVLLSLLACTMGALSLRRRVSQIRADKRVRHQEEVAMWEVELQKGRTGMGRREERERDLKTGGGLWDELKMPVPDDASTSHVNPKAPLSRSGKKSRTLWERVGASRTGSAPGGNESKEAEAQAHAHEHEHVEPEPQESLPAYMPPKRSSVVSSVGSLGVPGATRVPVHPRSFLEAENGR